MIKDVIVSMLIAKEIEFNQDEKYHNIFEVLNRVYVPTLPAVVITDVLVKILVPIDKVDELTGIEPEIHIFDKDDRLISNFFLPSFENLRTSENLPGIDIQTNIRFPVKVEGIYEYRLYFKNIHRCSNYIGVFSSEREIERTMKGGEQ